jgi:protease II
LSDKTCGDDGWGDCFRIVAVPRSGGAPHVIADREGAIFWIAVSRGDVYWVAQPRTSEKTLIRRWSSATGTIATVRDGEPTLSAETITDRGVVWIDNEGTTDLERVFLLRPGDSTATPITRVPSRELGNQHLAAEGDWLYLSNNTKLERFRLPDGPWEHLATSPHHVQNLFIGRDRIWWVTWDYKREARAVYSILKPRQ